MKKTLFLANVLALGGLEKVSVEIVNNLSLIEKITLYSLKGDTYGYTFENTLNYLTGGNLKSNSLKHPILTIKALVGKRLIQKKNLNFTMIEKDINFMEYSNVILSEADILYAKRIKKINSKIKVIGWIHNTFESYRDTYMKDSYTHFLENLLFVDTLIVLTESDKDAYSNMHSNIVKINNPLTIDKIGELPYKSKNQKKIGFVGRLEYKSKGLDYLINLADNLPDGWKISVAGDGYQRKKFEQEIQQKNLSDKFEIKGVLKEKELAEHYRECDIFVLTSRWEGFGLVITEAMYYGLPVVAFDSDGPREILGLNNEYGILVENGNLGKLIESINLLVNNIETRNHYSNQSLIRKQDYEIEKISPKWLNILN